MPHLMDHDATEIVTSSQQFENHDSNFITASLSIVNNKAIGYQIINFSELPYTITLDTHLADFKILTPEQITHIQPIDTVLLSFMIQNEETTDVYVNGLLKVPDPILSRMHNGSQPLKNQATQLLTPNSTTNIQRTPRTKRARQTKPT